MKKWYMQIAISLVVLILTIPINEIVYPSEIYPTKESIILSADPSTFYTLAIVCIAAQILLVVGIVRGFLTLIRKLRSFVRINQ